MIDALEREALNRDAAERLLNWGRWFAMVSTVYGGEARFPSAAPKGFRGFTTQTNNTQLFRAVDNAELKIISDSGIFKPNPFGTQVKYFARSIDDANWYGQKLYPNGYTVVKGYFPGNASKYWSPYTDIGAYIIPPGSASRIKPKIKF